MDPALAVSQDLIVTAGVWFTIYSIGYLGFSFTWLLAPLILKALGKQLKIQRGVALIAARHAALADEKTCIETRISPEDMPSWVFFPDKVPRFLFLWKSIGSNLSLTIFR